MASYCLIVQLLLPPGFTRGPLLENFWIHPWLNFQAAGNHDLFVLVLGHCVATSPSQSLDPAADLLTALREGEDLFFETLSAYSGRHAVIFGQVGDLSVVNDATGMKAVFYATQGGVVASHALLVEKALGGQIVQSELPYRYGYPGNRTPYARTKILTPNTYYWMTANVVRRFWPVVPPLPKSVDEAAYFLLESSTMALRSMGNGKNVGLTLTAGLDSRAVLAVALHSGIKFHTYTYRDDPASEVDRRFARDLAAKNGLTHFPIEEVVRNPSLDESVNESHYSLHHANWIGALRQHFQDPSSVAVIGNLLEIGRSNYSPARQKGAEPPTDARTMAALHHRKVGTSVKRRIDQYGPERFTHDSILAFQEFVEDTGYDIVRGLLDPFDQFYWEHRMAAWQGVAMGERDFYAEPFIPFNARNIFEVLLGVPSPERHSDKTILRMIEIVDPGLLELPINPMKWPAEVRV